MNPMRHRFSALAAFAFAAPVLAGCSGDSVTAPGGENEVISRVTVQLTPAPITSSGGSLTFGTASSAYIEDPDGRGPGAPAAQVGALSLMPSGLYTGAVRFENRLVSPIEDITVEVRNEADEHRVFYSVTGDGVNITATDFDANGRPLGVNFTVAVGATAAPGDRSFRVVLCHYGDTNKPANATSCTGDTDIDVSFAVTIRGDR